MREPVIKTLRDLLDIRADEQIKYYLECIARVMKFQKTFWLIPELSQWEYAGVWKRLNVTDWTVSIYVPWNADIVDQVMKEFQELGWTFGNIPNPTPGNLVVEIYAHHPDFDGGGSSRLSLKMYAEPDLENNPEIAAQQSCWVEMVGEEEISAKRKVYKIRCKEDINANRETAQPDSEPA